MSFSSFLSDIQDMHQSISDELNKKDPYCGFPSICEEKLKDYEHINKFVLEDVADSLSSIKLPPQVFPTKEFSNFPVTLVANDFFSIDLYFWFDMDTVIHNHHFCGAFKILEGSSTQISYEFKCEKVLDQFCSLGKLEKQEEKILKLGEVQKIDLYEKFIHQVFHNEFPTLTLCIRTNTNKEKEPISIFHYPGYRVTRYDLSINKKKWCVALNELLRVGKKPEVQLTDGEIISLLCRTQSHYYILQDHSRSFLFDVLKRRQPGIDLKKDLKFNLDYVNKLKYIYSS